MARRGEPVLSGAATAVQSLLARYLTSWPGRVAERSARDLVDVEIFDRAMTLAAQAFTSVFPILILVATLRPRGEDNPVGAGLGMLQKRAWGRVLGIGIAVLSVIVNLAFLSAYPIWCTIVIAFDVVVIYALAVHWEEVRTL